MWAVKIDLPSDSLGATGRRLETPARQVPASNGHAVPAGAKNAHHDVATAYFNGEYDSATAVEEFVNAIKGAM